MAGFEGFDCILLIVFRQAFCKATKLALECEDETTPVEHKVTSADRTGTPTSVYCVAISRSGELLLAGRETLMGVFNSAKSIENPISTAFGITYTISTLRIAGDTESLMDVDNIQTGQETPRVKKLVASDLAQLPSVKSGVSPRISLSLALERASVPNLPNRLTECSF
ncbi:hypothetical protein BDR06DRAFT_1015631 [Suillus hirtellus]|nr:hypothetical protein BDR06DRAFT_1015631 [Suillus hirtellus]